MTNILDLVGRVFISLVFLLSGFNKIGNYEGTVGWMESLDMSGIFLIPPDLTRFVSANKNFANGPIIFYQ